MRRVLVIGSGGAGKSTLAAQLSQRLDLPLIHLDAHYWQPGWGQPHKADWEQAVLHLLQGEAWVMDGNYGGTLKLRLAAADTVIFLDLPRLVCLWRVVKRWVRYYGRTRPEMGCGCPERLTGEFVRWIWRYRRDRRPSILTQIRAVAQAKRIVVLSSRAEVRRFINSLPRGAA